MHELATLAKGFVVGGSIAAPVGPIGVLCIRRSLTQGRLIGFVSGLGAATADAFYAAVAGFGLTALSQFFVHHARPLHLAGGLLLLYLGVRTAFAPRASEATGGAPTDSRLGAYASTLLLTITNPMTIFMFAAIFTAIAPANGPDAAYAALLDRRHIPRLGRVVAVPQHRGRRAPPAPGRPDDALDQRGLRRDRRGVRAGRPRGRVVGAARPGTAA